MLLKAFNVQELHASVCCDRGTLLLATWKSPCWSDPLTGRTGMQEFVLSGSGFCCLAKSTAPVSQNLFLAKCLFKKKLTMFSAVLWLQMRSSIKAAENWKKKKKPKKPQTYFFFKLVPFNFYHSPANGGVSREQEKYKVWSSQPSSPTWQWHCKHQHFPLQSWSGQSCSCQLPLVHNKIILNQNRWPITLLCLKGSPNSYKGEKPPEHLAPWGLQLPGHTIICTI